MKGNQLFFSFCRFVPTAGRGVWILLLLVMISRGGGAVMAQFSLGMTGGLNIPTARIAEDGTFSTGGNYLPRQMMPKDLNYNSGNYYFNIAFFSFLELNYRSTLLHFRLHRPLESKYVWNKDRSVGIRIRLLKEGRRWLPAVAVGSNDVVTTGSVMKLTDDRGNRYFASVYGVATRSLRFDTQELRLTAGYYVPFYKRSDREGIFGGVEWIPPHCCWLSVLGEYDCKVVNLGLRANLFGHLSLQVFCYDFRAVSAGIRYSLNLLGKEGRCGGY